MTYRKTENFVACVVTCVNHLRTNSLYFQNMVLGKTEYSNAVNTPDKTKSKVIIFICYYLHLKSLLNRPGEGLTLGSVG